MTIRDLALHDDTRLLLGPRRMGVDVARIYASNTMSDLIANASSDTLLVTSLNNTQLIRIAELMDVPGICLVDGASPCPELLASARASGTAILVSPHGFDAASRLLEARLRGAGARP